MLWMPTRVAYSIKSGQLEISTNLGLIPGSRRVPLDAIVEVRDVNLSGGTRQAGTTLPGFCQGRFIYPEIGPVWQATDCSRQALLLRVSGQERPILLTPPDRMAFQAALHQGSRMDIVLPNSARPDTMLRVVRVVALVLVLPVMLVPLLFFVAPGRLRYRVEAGMLHVVTWSSEKHFVLTGATATRTPASRAFKLVGSAMPGYYTGWFRVNGANTRVYATTLKDGVLIRADGVVFVSPADVGGFLDALAANGTRRN
jgi:hypothetical protein